MPLNHDKLMSMKFEPARGLVVEDFGRVEWEE